jgi:hypothetical protein
VIVQFNLERERELLITHKVLQFLQEGLQLLFQGPLVVFDFRRPLFQVVSSNFGLPVLFASERATSNRRRGA